MWFTNRPNILGLMPLFLILTLFSCLLNAQEKLPDFNQIKNISEKKQAFFNYLTPLAQKANRQIKEERTELIRLRDTNKLNSKNYLWLRKISTKYKENIKGPLLFDKLLKKVDTLPPSLLLAQAANESAWGSSRFAREGNNLFGQWCYQLNCGMVPKQRTQGKHHEVRTFNSVFDSINAYLLNINTNASYDNLRKLREAYKAQKKRVTGSLLAKGLRSYSERGAYYVNDIISFIKHNRLEKT